METRTKPSKPKNLRGRLGTAKEYPYKTGSKSPDQLCDRRIHDAHPSRCDPSLAVSKPFLIPQRGAKCKTRPSLLKAK